MVHLDYPTESEDGDSKSCSDPLENVSEDFKAALRRIVNKAPLLEKALPETIVEVIARDKYFGKRKKDHFPRAFYNRHGRTWELRWSYEQCYMVWLLMGFFLLRGRVTGRIIGFQIWGSPLRLLWSLLVAILQRFRREGIGDRAKSF